MDILHETFQALVEHAQKDAPLEACGYLGSSEGTIVAHFPMTNTDRSPEHFQLDPKEQFDTVRQIRKQGLELCGVYHSHPTTPARPSEEDLRLSIDPNLSYVIVSLAEGENSIKSFRVENGRAHTEDLTIRSKEPSISFYQIPDSLHGEIEEMDKSLQDFLAGRISPVAFRAIRVPFGIYEQRQDGTYMVRIRCTAGGITPTQLGTVAELSREFGADFLHLTTRQGLQIHDVDIHNVIPVLRRLLTVNLTTRGDGGNTVRNIMASWDAGISNKEKFDVTPYAVSLSSRLISESDSWVLPRKYKISFAGSEEDNADAAFNDLGFVARRSDGVEGFKVYVAGGTGSKPQIGKLLHEFIPGKDVYRVAEAVKRLFDKHGNRKNKHAARLRFLWQKLGKEEFVRLYKREREILEENPDCDLILQPIENEYAHPVPPATGREGNDFTLWKKRYTRSQKQPGLFSVTIPVFLGNLPNRHARKLAEFLTSVGENTIRLTMTQNLSLRNIPAHLLAEVYNISRDITPLSLQPSLLGDTVACAGPNTCRLGICLPRGASRAIRDHLEITNLSMDDLGQLRIQLSGCPDTCGQHMSADLGFYGRASRKGEVLYPAYRVVAGARRGGDNPSLAVSIGEIPARNLPLFVEDALRAFHAKKKAYRSFEAYVAGNGRWELEEICRKYSAVPDFADNKDFYYDWGAQDPFNLAGKGKGECSAGLFDLIDEDLSQIQTLIPNLENGNASTPDIHATVLASSRMLLITRGVQADTEKGVFDAFLEHFIDAGLVGNEHRDMVVMVRAGKADQLANASVRALALAREIQELYKGMDDSLRFPAEKLTKPAGHAEDVGTGVDLFKDFRGVACPMNFVKTKIALSELVAGQVLKILLDDGEPIRNVPRSVEEEGHQILGQNKTGTIWEVVIRKRAG